MEKISAVIITYNEQGNIERCLASLDWVDEILVVDSFSTDHTVEIAKKYTRTIIQHEWEGFVRQKIYATSQASHDWILSIDADEEISHELKTEILAIRQTGFTGTAYQMPRKVLYLGKWIRYGGWYPDYKMRLFNRKQGQWMGVEVHEYWQSTGKCSRLKGDLLHYSYKNISDHLNKINNLTTIAASELRGKNIKASFLSLMINPFAKFLKAYFIKTGFLDGFVGLVIALLGSYYVFLKYLKLWELQQMSKN
jgi:glycosyltransferase involved in cell wall biosynthesis